ncbi:hypothetical protein CsSME_00005940 [Camellia sinensis var. sinensis]
MLCGSELASRLLGRLLDTTEGGTRECQGLSWVLASRSWEHRWMGTASPPSRLEPRANCSRNPMEVISHPLGYHRGGTKELIEYDHKLVNFRQLLEVFWSSHDSRQVFGQGPDVGSQYRSIIFTNGSEESRLAAVSKEREQTKSKSSIVTTQIQQLRTFYPAEPEHQKFELKRNPLLLQLIGNLPEVELESSSLAAKLNSYSAELCPTKIQKQIDAKIDNIIKKGWPILREL